MLAPVKGQIVIFSLRKLLSSLLDLPFPIYSNSAILLQIIFFKIGCTTMEFCISVYYAVYGYEA